MNTSSSRTEPGNLRFWLPRAASIGLIAVVLALPTTGSTQGRGGGGRSDSGRSDSGSGRSDSGRSDSGRSDSGRSDSGRSTSGRSDSGGGGGSYQREAPVRRDDPPARRDVAPPRDDSSYRRNDPTPQRSDTSTRRNDPTPDRSTTRDSGSTRRDVSPSDRPAARENPPSDRTLPRDSTGAAPRTGDRTQRTDKGNTPVRDTKPSDTTRTRPSTDPRPERDYRGDRYTGGSARGTAGDSSKNQTANRGTSRAEDARPSRDRGFDIFSRSREGRQYNNGVVLRGGGYIGDRGVRRFFQRDYCYYPYYYPTYDPVIVFYSPYSYYYDVCPPFIYRSHCHYYPPVSIWIDVPLYSGVEFRSWGGHDDEYYLDRRDYYTDPSRLPDKDLENAVLDVREAFRFNNINLLANLTDKSVRIAVFLKGKYDYSLDAGDYLDMTRDMFASTETLEFDIQQIHRRSPDVWVVSGKQVYLNRDNKRRAVYVSFVLERVNNRWTITQVGTAPDRIEEPNN